ncbi:hypothetical protein Misp01_77900 [Microtetraspora sp. NBRC 13810]|uniref:YbaB/EbfC family nucleoid-associated protein n=1 Tax=Microtetraspora sp. NBRC 13810 TaxID=3030990 RepID=UPI0024A47F0A|nr:YbaB/EbfC family nucleoid-associated protein [Microtetraspora sp. NBRC 13810]GLW12662.1 hypothetical protein Misp01_77900 [Microtetraspora sp. NBRC 13810]
MNTLPTGDPEFDRAMAEFRAQNTRLDEAGQRFEQLRGRGKDASGHVTAEVLPSGSLVALTFDPRALRLSAADLAEAVLAATRAAEEDAGAQAEEIVTFMHGG